MATWSAAFVNNLPDSSFLYIAPGGKKDGEGKTTPRSLRFFPVKDQNGKVDLPHLRNALARIPQSNIPAAAKTAATRAARRMLDEETKKVSKMETITKAIDGNMVEIQKIDLGDGEELNEFIREVVKAVRKLSIDAGDEGPIMLHGIYKDHVVVKQFGMGGGTYYRASWSRDKAGAITLGELQQVRMTFTPVPGGKVKKGEGDEELDHTDPAADSSDQDALLAEKGTDAADVEAMNNAREMVVDLLPEGEEVLDVTDAQ